jgi:hypothetical protein
MKWFPSSGEVREEIIIQMSGCKAKAEKGTVPIRTYAPLQTLQLYKSFVISYSYLYNVNL